MEDAEERRHGAVDAAAGRFEAGPSGVVDGHDELCPPGGPPEDVRRRRTRAGSLVCHRERSKRLAELAQARHIGL